MHARYSKGFRSPALGTGKEANVTSVCPKSGTKESLYTYPTLLNHWSSQKFYIVFSKLYEISSWNRENNMLSWVNLAVFITKKNCGLGKCITLPMRVKHTVPFTFTSWSQKTSILVKWWQAYPVLWFMLYDTISTWKIKHGATIAAAPREQHMCREQARNQNQQP